MATSGEDGVSFPLFISPSRARGAPLSPSSSSTLASLHTFCETSRPPHASSQPRHPPPAPLATGAVHYRGVRELATCLTHFSVGVNVFPVLLLFHLGKEGKMPKLSQLNPGRRCFCSSTSPLSCFFFFFHKIPPPTTNPTSNLHVSRWLGLVSRAWTRGIQTNSVTARSLMHPKAALCSRCFSNSPVVSG